MFEDIMKVLVVAASAGGLWSVIMVVRVWVRRMEREQGDPAQITELREGMQRLSSEVADLQERVDFAERMLAQQRQPGRIGEG